MQQPSESHGVTTRSMSNSLIVSLVETILDIHGKFDCSCKGTAVDTSSPFFVSHYILIQQESKVSSIMIAYLIIDTRLHKNILFIP